jgi:hypothetical protein
MKQPCIISVGSLSGLGSIWTDGWRKSNSWGFEDHDFSESWKDGWGESYWEGDLSFSRSWVLNSAFSIKRIDGSLLGNAYGSPIPVT